MISPPLMAKVCVPPPMDCVQGMAVAITSPEPLIGDGSGRGLQNRGVVAEPSRTSLPAQSPTTTAPAVLHDCDRRRNNTFGNRKRARVGARRGNCQVAGADLGDPARARLAAMAGRQGQRAVRRHDECRSRPWHPGTTSAAIEAV